MFGFTTCQLTQLMGRSFHWQQQYVGFVMDLGGGFLTDLGFSPSVWCFLGTRVQYALVLLVLCGLQLCFCYWVRVSLEVCSFFWVLHESVLTFFHSL